MNTAIISEMSSTIAPSSQSAALLALAFGLLMGVMVSSMEISTALIQRRLRIKEDEGWKYFALLMAVGLVVFLLCGAVITLVFPPYDVRAAIFERNLEVLGYPLFFVAVPFGMAFLSIPARRLAHRITSFIDDTEDGVSS